MVLHINIIKGVTSTVRIAHPCTQNPHGSCALKAESLETTSNRSRIAHESHPNRSLQSHASHAPLSLQSHWAQLLSSPRPRLLNFLSTSDLVLILRVLFFGPLRIRKHHVRGNKSTQRPGARTRPDILSLAFLSLIFYPCYFNIPVERSACCRRAAMGSLNAVLPVDR